MNLATIVVEWPAEIMEQVTQCETHGQKVHGVADCHGVT